MQWRSRDPEREILQKIEVVLFLFSLFLLFFYVRESRVLGKCIWGFSRAYIISKQLGAWVYRKRFVPLLIQLFKDKRLGINWGKKVKILSKYFDNQFALKLEYWPSFGALCAISVRPFTLFYPGFWDFSHWVPVTWRTKAKMWMFFRTFTRSTVCVICQESILGYL